MLEGQKNEKRSWSQEFCVDDSDIFAARASVCGVREEVITVRDGDGGDGGDVK